MTDASREQILKALRTNLPQSSPLPDLPASGPWQTFDDPFAHFCDVLQTVGGVCYRVPDRNAANQALEALDAWREATQKVSLTDGIGQSTFDVEKIDDPHDLESTEFAVLRGHFMVAENAAIWVSSADVPHRVLYFLPQHIALVVASGQIVHNMHEAYGRISVADNHFGAFISGPSKTADIEQSLVIGAHGARSLTVLAVDELD